MPKWLTALAFLATVLFVWGGVHVYLYFRLASTLDLSSRARLVLKIALMALAALYLVGRLVDAALDERVGWGLMWPGALWMGVLGILLSCVVAFDLWVCLPTWILQRAAAIGETTAHSIRHVGMIAAAVGALALSGWGVVRALAGPSVTHLTVALPGLPQSGNGFSIGVVSDIHVGDMVTHAYVDRLARQLDTLDLDMVVLVGDPSDERNGGDGSAFDRLAHVTRGTGLSP